MTNTFLDVNRYKHLYSTNPSLTANGTYLILIPSSNQMVNCQVVRPGQHLIAIFMVYSKLWWRQELPPDANLSCLMATWYDARFMGGMAGGFTILHEGRVGCSWIGVFISLGQGKFKLRLQVYTDQRLPSLVRAGRTPEVGITFCVFMGLFLEENLSYNIR